MTFNGIAKLAIGLALTGMGAPSQAASGPDAVVCLIASLDLHFPEPSPVAKGAQWGEGHVEIRCTSTSNQTQRVSVEVVENSDSDNASTHPLTTRQPHGPPLFVSFFADQQRSKPLGSSRSNAQALRASLQIAGNSTSLHRVPVYASFQLEALMAAGTYNGNIPLKLTYRLQP
ncbi:MAG: spore coat protein U domain-containing protein [Hydrogenophaga sp.]|uniref:spore coat protein U domain-containing protein n=1 Tax=Hydrogenophaga sp. TaxID=1904254 RepID=UPI002AB86ED2|nr:spore coat protein U domain-containing protein [Hydrogenophaga sp.]MDZ4100990.1 spore coat protein U domain-containing protein [Hydrogenophaga sp.]MDZ4239519.1 spore coat protein U domain-containing protein [Hydrogenophaga sp.]